MDDYSDRVQVCPKCGNERVGHTDQTDFCITDPSPKNEYGCGWFQVVKYEPTNLIPESPAE